MDMELKGQEIGGMADLGMAEVNNGLIPFYNDAIQILSGGVESGTDNTVNDVKNPLVITDKAKYVENNAVYYNGSTYASVTVVVDIGANDFTFEGWRNLAAGGGAQVYIASYSTGDNQRSFRVQKEGNGDITLVTSLDGTFNLGVTSEESRVLAANVPQSVGHIKMLKSGTAVTWEFNGVPVPATGSAVSSIYYSTAPILISARFSNYTTSPTTVLDTYTGLAYGDKFSVAGTELICYECAEGAGLTLHNHLSAAYNATLTGSANPSDFWGVATQDDRAANVFFGFSLYEHATLEPLRVPFINGSPNPAPVIPSGYTLTDHFPPTWHNNSESKVLQTTADAQMLNRGAWSDDGLAMDARSYDEINTYYNTNNGQDGVWYSRLANGSFEEAYTDDYDKHITSTPTRVKRFEDNFGGTSAAVTDGGEYVTNNGYVVFN